MTKRETEEQLSELRMTLKKLESGNMTLIDSQNEMQLVSERIRQSCALRQPVVPCCMHACVFLNQALELTLQLSGPLQAIQSAIAAAFKTPEVLAMFARKQPDQLRLKLAQVERDHKIKLLPSESFQQQKLEILMALKKLKEPISEAEQQFLQANSSQSMKEFEQVPDQSLDQLVLSSLDAV